MGRPPAGAGRGEGGAGAQGTAPCFSLHRHRPSRHLPGRKRRPRRAQLKHGHGHGSGAVVFCRGEAQRRPPPAQPAARAPAASPTAAVRRGEPAGRRVRQRPTAAQRRPAAHRRACPARGPPLRHLAAAARLPRLRLQDSREIPRDRLHPARRHRRQQAASHHAQGGGVHPRAEAARPGHLRVGDPGPPAVRGRVRQRERAVGEQHQPHPPQQSHARPGHGRRGGSHGHGCGQLPSRPPAEPLGPAAPPAPPPAASAAGRLPSPAQLLPARVLPAGSRGCRGRRSADALTASGDGPVPLSCARVRKGTDSVPCYLTGCYRGVAQLGANVYAMRAFEERERRGSDCRATGELESLFFAAEAMFGRLRSWLFTCAG
ncbi:uncharacterized protein LOC144149941 isoform X1 [Haemaphysalis longicornis]